MLKRALAMIMAWVLLLSLFSGCSKSDGNYLGDPVGKDTLVICVDPLYGIDAYSHEPHVLVVKEILRELGELLKKNCGIEKIAFELLPYNGVERETALQRLRTEIMAGEGPDVFLMRTLTTSEYDVDKRSALFKFPEKNMEVGLFLPLDEYMEKNSRFTNWDAQTGAVLNAGRSDEGQVVIPMTYDFLFFMYPRAEVKIPYTTELTRREILDNPETAELGTLLYSDILKADEKPVDSIWRVPSLLPNMLGELVDYETDELLFTEEELYDLLSETYALYDDAAKNEHQYMKNFASYWTLIYEVYNAYFDTDMAMVPMYTVDGGVTATVTSYAAVNRGTRHPEEAFAVIDYIMSEDMQRKGDLYSQPFNLGLPLQNDLGSKEKPLRAKHENFGLDIRYLDDMYFEDLLCIKDQITAVNFDTDINAVLSDLVLDTRNNGELKREDVSEAYEKIKRLVGE